MRFLSIFLSSILIITGLNLTALPASASAETIPSPPSSNIPTTIHLVETTSTTNPNQSILTATLDHPLEETNSTATLYKANDGTMLDSKTSGQEIEFTVDKPATGYQQYKVVVNNLSSNLVTVNSVDSVWNVKLSTDKFLFGTNESLPTLTWESNIDVSNQPGKSLYLYDLTASQLISKSLTTDGKSKTVTIPNFYDGTHEYVLYVGPSSLPVINATTLSQTASTISNTVRIVRKTWTINIQLSNTEFTTDGPAPTLTWTTNQSLEGTSSTYYYVFIIDKTINQDIWVSPYTLTGLNGTITLPTFSAGGPHTYQALVASRSATGAKNTIYASSNTDEVKRTDWTVTIATDYSTFEAGQTPTLSWATNQKLNSTYKLLVYDETDSNNKTFVGSVTSAVNSGTINLATPYNTSTARTYRAYITASNPGTPFQSLTDIQTSSNPISVERKNWTISITGSTEFDITQSPSINWETNQFASNTNSYFRVYIIDETSGKIVQGSTNSILKQNNVNVTPWSTGGPHTFKAYVAESYVGNFPTTVSDLKNIQATSNSFQIARKKWAVELSLTSVVPQQDSTNLLYLTGTANQYITGGTYGLYLVNEITGKTVYVPGGAGNTSTLDGKTNIIIPKQDKSSFRAYIARKANPSPTTKDELQDIQAISGIVLPDEFTGPTNTSIISGFNPAQANCNQQCHADPVNSATGEFYENNEDLTISSLLPFSFARNYSSSRKDKDTGLGYGWRSNYEMEMKALDNKPFTQSNAIQLTQENGSPVTFYKDGDIYLTENYVLADLTYNITNNRFYLERKTGYRAVFDGTNGKLIQIEDRNGNYLQLTYNNNQLTTVSDNSGKNLSLTWTDGHISKVQAGTGETVTYSYTTNNDLKEVTVPEIENPKKYTYTSTHLVKTLTTVDNASTVNTYDTSNRVIQQENPAGGLTKFQYDGLTTTITNPDNSVAKELYNTKGQLAQQTLASGTPKQLIVEYHYNNAGQNDWVKTNNNLLVSYTYDTNGNVLTHTDAEGNLTKYTYNNYNQLLTTKNALGNTATNNYDANGNLISTTSFAGNTTKYEHNLNGTISAVQNPTEVTANSNKKTQLFYDTNGYINKIVTPEGLTTQFTNKPNGLPLTSVDLNNNVTTNEYDSHNRLVKTIYPDNTEQTNTYNNAGQIVKTVNTQQIETTYTYDQMGNVKTKTTPQGTTTYTYGNNGQVSQVEDYAGRKTSYQYDIAGNVSSVTSPENRTTNYTYNNLGQLTEEKDAANVKTQYEYNKVGSLTKETYNDNSTVQYIYDANQQLKQTTDQMGNNVTYQYTADGLLASTTKPDNSVTKTEYDADGNIIKKIKEDNTADTYVYDSDGKIISSTNNNNETTQYHYNNLGLLQTKTNPDATRVDYNYDTMGNVKQISYDNWATINTAYDYNVKGLLDKATTNGNITKYGYDVIGNLTYRGPPSGVGGINYHYNTANNVSSIEYPSGLTLNYSYNKDNQITKVKSNTTDLATYTYKNNGLLDTTNYGNGITEQRSYNNINSLSKLEDKTAGLFPSTLYSYEVTNNKVGLPIQETTQYSGTNSETTNNQYDTRYRLASQETNNSTKNYGFDTVTNLVTLPGSTQTFNNLGQVTTKTQSSAVSQYSYDSRGNRSAKNVTDSQNNSKSTSYSWSVNNQLTQVNLPENKTVSYTYDESNLLTSKTVTGLSTLFSTEQLTWDANKSVPTLIEDGTNNYVYGVSSNPFAQINKNTGAVTYLHGDQQGSIVLTTDDQGTTKTTYKYDAYGKLAKETGDSGHSVTPFAYVGEYQDTDTGLYNLRARWYEPETASFISKDPLNSVTSESYSYASGNPLYYTDPLGLFSWNDASQFGFGALDSITFGFSTLVLKAVNPNLIDECNPAFTWGGITADVVSFLVPGVGAAALLTKVAGKLVTATVKLTATVGKDIYSAVSRLRPYLNDIKKAFSNEKGSMSFNAMGDYSKTLVKPTLPSHIDPMTLPVFKLDYQSYPEVAKHISDAIKSGQPTVLQKTSIVVTKKNRYQATKQIKTAKGFERDEYPFGSTSQGGMGASARLVTKADNSQHGYALRDFYAKNKITIGDWYRVEI